LRKAVRYPKKGDHKEQLPRRYREEEGEDKHACHGKRYPQYLVIGKSREFSEDQPLRDDDPQTDVREKISDVA